MEWSTIPVEILEFILVATASPRNIVNACRTCKAWLVVFTDQHLWKAIYKSLSCAFVDETDDWKRKVMDFVLVRKNIRNGRCVVRTLCAKQSLTSRHTLEPDNISIYKDHCLVNWLTMESYGSYDSIKRAESHLINMVTEDVVKLDNESILLVNRFLVSTTRDYYGGVTFDKVVAQEFDPTTRLSASFTDAVEFKIPRGRRSLITNHCTQSNFVGLCESEKITVINAETGQIAYSLDKTMANRCNAQLYDTVLVFQQKDTLNFLDILTGKKFSKHFAPPVHPGFMNDHQIAVRTADQIVLYDYKKKEEQIYPAEKTPRTAVSMMYSDMWVFCFGSTLSFYDMQSGSLLNSVALKNSNDRATVGLLSDGRFAIINRGGCSVVSFVDSEVNRKIKVALLGTNGSDSVHEISAFGLPKFFNYQVHGGLENMTSRIVPYAPTATTDERFVMILSVATASTVNAKATDLLKSAVTPTNINTPYQGWKIDVFGLLEKGPVPSQAFGNVIIVKEKKLAGRWQLASM